MAGGVDLHPCRNAECKGSRTSIRGDYRTLVKSHFVIHSPSNQSVSNFLPNSSTLQDLEAVPVAAPSLVKTFPSPFVASRTTLPVPPHPPAFGRVALCGHREFLRQDLSLRPVMGPAPGRGKEEARPL